MPDGTVIQNVPDGVTQSEILRRYGNASSEPQPTVQPPVESKPQPFQEPKEMQAPSRLIPLSEIEGGEQIAAENEVWLYGSIPGEQINSWKEMGEIGFGEAAAKFDKWELFPVLNGVALIEDLQILKTFNRYKEGGELTINEKEQLKEFVLDMAEIQSRGYSIGGKIANGLLPMPAYMAEIALAVGLSGLTFGAGAPAAVAGASAKVAGKQAIKELSKRVGEKALAYGKTAAVAEAIMLPRVGKKYANDQLNDGIAITDKGRVFFQEAERSPATYFLRAAASVYVENFVELAGGEVLRPVAGGVRKGLSKALPDKFVKGFQELLKKTDNTILRKAGFSGILEEIGEERLSALLITSFDLDPERGYTTEQFISAIFPDAEDFLVEAGVISIMGVSSRASIGMYNVLKNRGVKEKDISAILDNMSETEIEAQLARFTEQEKSTPDAILNDMKASLDALENTDTTNMSQSEVSTLEAQIESTYLQIEQLQESQAQKRLEEIEAQEGKGKIVVPKRPETLADFIRSRGGISTNFADPNGSTIDMLGAVNKETRETMTGEVMKLAKKNSPELKGVAKKTGTLTLDQAREYAEEAGFIPEGSDINDFLNALSRESDGQVSVRDSDLSALENYNRALEYNEDVAMRNAEISTDSKSVASFSAAFKQGVAKGKKDVKAIQKALEKAINKTALSKADKEKFTKRIINTQTERQLRTIAPKIEKSINSLLNAEAKRKQETALKKQLTKKALKPKTQGSKKVGKFNADIQDRLEQISEAYKLSEVKASKLLNEQLNLKEQDVLLNKVLKLKIDGKDATASDIAEVVAEIKAIKILGVAEAAARKDRVKKESKEIRDEISGFIDQRIPDLMTRKETGVKSSGRSLRQSSRSLISLIAGNWNELIDRIAPAATVRKLKIGREVSKKKGIQRRMLDRLAVAANEAYELNGNKRQLNKTINEGNEVLDLGVYVNIRGEEVRIEMSKAQIRKLWMAAQNKNLLENTIMSKKGNGWTKTMLVDVFSVLDEADFKFAQAQLKLYEEFYPDINEVYSRVFGINLDKVDFYSPISRDVDANETNPDAFLRQETQVRALASGTAIKLRDSGAVSPLVFKSDIEAYAQHITQMAHFIAFREKTMLLDRVFGDAKMRAKLEKSMGKRFVGEIKNAMDAIAETNVAENNIMQSTINYLNRNFATSVLGLKAKIGYSQLSSIPAYAEYIPTKDFFKGFADFFINYKEAISILSQTELMQDRGADPNVDLARMGQAFNSKLAKKIGDKQANLIDMTLFFTKFGDRAAIYSGGWSVYKYTLKKTGSHEKAIEAFEDATSETQQSKDVDQLSHVQMSNAFTRGLTMFMTAPIAQFRGEIRAVRRYRKGEYNKRQLAKGLIIYHVLIPQLYTALAGGLPFVDIDEEDHLRALALGSLSGIPLLGTVVNEAFREIQDKPNMPRNAVKAIDDAQDVIIKGFDLLMDGTDGDWEEALEVMVEISKGGAALRGLPVSGAEKIVEGVVDISDGDTKKGAMKAAGFPNSVTDSMD